MTDQLLIALLIVGALSLILLIALLVRQKKQGMGGTDADVTAQIKQLEKKIDSIGTMTDFNTRTMDALNRSTEARLNNIQARLSDDFKYMVEANEKNLERIRRTVDDKLTSSIDGKLSDSFAKISERLEKMHRSVGEMKSLSEGIADIRRVFTNVKLRGTWGEAQLDALLSQMLSPDQYEASVKLNPLDNSLVDFAIRLPSKDGETIYLPVDSKFPVEEYSRLCEASERCDREGEEAARKNLARAIKLQADSISKKYVLPPKTTDFAVMYLPLEGLYAEVIKAEGLSDYLHSRRVLPCGPTNLGALLSTLQTGFKTAAIERRSGELRRMLVEFQADFEKFSDLLDKTRKKLQEAQDSIDSAGKRTNAIGRKLSSFNSFDILPPGEE